MIRDMLGGAFAVFLFGSFFGVVLGFCRQALPCDVVR